MIMAKEKPRKSGKNPWPKRLQALREKLDITQAEAAKLADVATRTWISWENDQRTPSRAMQIVLRQLFPDLAE